MMEVVTLNAVGDFILHGLDQTKEYPFEFVSHILKDADLVLGNHETVLTECTEPFFQKSFAIRTPLVTSCYVTQAGFDLVHLANNHIFDFGVQGALDTIQELDRLGVAHLGVGATPEAAAASVIVERKGIRVGFIGAGHGCASISKGDQSAYCCLYETDDFLDHVKKLKSKVDIVILSIHWDYEAIDLPHPSIQTLARSLIDGGVDLILGHHPHIPHGIERYKEGVIVYSLGNFQFRQTLRPELAYSFIFSIQLSHAGLGPYSIIPIMIQSDSRPRLANNLEAKVILTFIEKVSLPLSKGITNDEFEDAAAEIFFKDNMDSWAKRVEEFGEEHFYQCLEWLAEPVHARRFWRLVKKKNWSIRDFIKSLDIQI